MKGPQISGFISLQHVTTGQDILSFLCMGKAEGEKRGEMQGEMVQHEVLLQRVQL